jgi:hypothetical protein
MCFSRYLIKLSVIKTNPKTAKIFGAGAIFSYFGYGSTELGPEPKEIFTAPQHC